MTVEEVMRQVRQDVGYYRRTGGGMTISGGELLMQGDFAEALLDAAVARGSAWRWTPAASAAASGSSAWRKKPPTSSMT